MGGIQKNLPIIEVFFAFLHAADNQPLHDATFCLRAVLRQTALTAGIHRQHNEAFRNPADFILEIPLIAVIAMELQHPF